MYETDRQFYTEEFPAQVRRFEHHLAEYFNEELEIVFEGGAFKVEFDEGYLEFDIGENYFAVEDIIVSEYKAGLGIKIMRAIEDFCIQAGLSHIIARNVEPEAIDFWEKKVNLQKVQGATDWMKEV